jgi:hypothetical protein
LWLDFETELAQTMDQRVLVNLLQMAAAVVAMNGVAGFTNDLGELEWSIFHAGDLAEKNERGRKKSNQKPPTSFRVPRFPAANHHTQFTSPSE